MNSWKRVASLSTILLLAISTTRFDHPLGTIKASPSSASFAVSGVVRSSTNPPANGCAATASAQVKLTFTRVSGSGPLPPSVQPSAGNDPAMGWKQSGFETGTVYRVTPSLEGFVFSPAHLDFDGEKGDLNFTIFKAPLTVSGRITDGEGRPLDGVTVEFHRQPIIPGPPTGLIGAPVQSNSGGNWQKELGCESGCSAAHRLAAVPSKPGMFFVPEAIQFCGSATGLNFVGRPLEVTSVSAASFKARPLARDSIIAAYGSNFATTTETAPGLPLPTTLAGVTVRIKDAAGVEHLAPLFFVAPNQINCQMPSDAATGTALVTIANSQGRSFHGPSSIADLAPGLFAANATGQGVATAVAQRFKPDGSVVFEAVARFDPALNQFVPAPIDLGPEGDQVFLVLFGTGIRHSSPLSAYAVKLGGTDGQVAFAGAQGTLAGLDQVNVRLPRSLIGRGEVDVVLTAQDAASNAVRVSFK